MLRHITSAWTTSDDTYVIVFDCGGTLVNTLFFDA